MNSQWLANGSTVLPLTDGTRLDLAPALAGGRVWIASFGPERCRLVNTSPLHAARRIYFDRSFGACDESLGIMAPAYAAAYKRSRRAWRGPRRHEVFFYGHVPKPYLEWPVSSLRYRIWRDLFRRNEPRMLLGGVDVTRTVAPYAVAEAGRRCAKCSYGCKQCYHDPEALSYKNAPPLPADEFFAAMAHSEWCVVARGDTPHTSKLTEAILAGCACQPNPPRP